MSGANSFPKASRLLRRSDFRRVYKEGRRRNTSLCTIFFRANGSPLTRVGITTPKTCGNSVLRNRLKRRLREVFRLNRAAIPGGWDIVLNPCEPAATVPFQTLAQEVLRLFPRTPPAASSGQAQPQ